MSRLWSALRIIGGYVLCLIETKNMAKAVNGSDTASELDAEVKREAGIR